MYIEKMEIDRIGSNLVWEGDFDGLYKAIYQYENKSEIPFVWTIDPHGDTFQE